MILDRFDLAPDTLQARFAEHAPAVTTQVAERAVADAVARLAASTPVISSTCTAYLCPGLTSYPSERLGLRSDVGIARLAATAQTATLAFRIDDHGQLLRSRDGGQNGGPCMAGWRIPRANSFFFKSQRILASGPGGSYVSGDGEVWSEAKLWPELKTGAADFLHAYWMGRCYGFIRGWE